MSKTLCDFGHKKFFYRRITKSSPLNSTNYTVLYPQNGDRIVTIDYVTSLHPVYRRKPHFNASRANTGLLVHVCHTMSTPEFKHKMQETLIALSLIET